MSTPTLEITTMIGCPLNCTFCPQDQLKSAYGKTGAKYLSFEDFQTVLGKIPQSVRIDFSGMSEPWANPWATRMLEYALQCGYRVAIYTTLYGMSAEDATLITTQLLPKHQSQVDIVCLHLPDEEGNMRGYKPSDEYNEVLGKFIEMMRFGAFPAQKLAAMTMHKCGKVHSSLADQVKQLMPWRGHSRAGSLGEERIEKVGAMQPPRNEFPLVCAKTPFYDQNVLFPGYSKCSICKSCERAVEPKEISCNI